MKFDTIDEPDWVRTMFSCSLSENRERIEECEAAKDRLSKWFDKEVRQVLKGKICIDRDDLVEVYSQNPHWGICKQVESTEKAYLIKSSIEPIEKKSREELALELLEDINLHTDVIEKLKRWPNLHKEVKKLLEGQ